MVRKGFSKRWHLSWYVSIYKILVFKKLFMYLFYLVIFSCAGSLLLCGLSLVVVSRGLLFIAVHGLLIAVAFLVVEHGL